MANWGYILVGFVVSTVGGHIVLWPLVNKILWPSINKDYPKKRWLIPDGLTWVVGLVERSSITAALLAHAPEWIGVWLGIKVITRWQEVSNEQLKKGAAIWLIGTGISVSIGVLGGWIALHFGPLMPPKH